MAEVLVPNNLYVMPWRESQREAGETLLKRVTAVGSRDHLTRITLYSGYNMGHDFKHVLDLKSVVAVDNWLLAHTRRLDEFVGSYQRRDEKVRYPGQYDTIKTANYIRVENFYGESPVDKIIWYGMVTNVSYVNDGTTEIDWAVDSWMTFNSQRFLTFIGDTFVERAHIDDFTQENEQIKLANINPESQAMATSPQIADIYDLNFGGSWSNNINFAIYWLMPNFGDTSPSENLPNQSYSFEGAPSMLQPFVFAYDVKRNMTVKIEVNSSVGTYSTQGGTPVTYLIAALATDPDVVGHRNFVSANATEYFGVAWRYDATNNKVVIDHWDSPSGNLTFKEYKPAGQTDTMLYFSELVNGQRIQANLKLSAYQMARAAQLQTLQHEGYGSYQIRNVKTSMTPFTGFNLVDGFGGRYEYDTSYVNYENPNLPITINRIGGAGYSNKVHTAINRYKDISSDDETGAFTNLKTITHGILQTEDKQLPIVSDTYVATNAVNLNSNKMVYKNAQNTKQNNHLSNQATLANMNTNLGAQASQLKNTQATARKTMDMKTGANLVEGLGSTIGVDVGRGAANAVTGAIGGALSGAGGGLLGAGLGAATGAYGGFNQVAIQNAQLGNEATNMRIGQAATRETTKNSVQTSEMIANNNYENAIENFQAQQADLGLAADNLTQMGGDVFFSYMNGLNLTKLVITTETAQRIIQVDSYFTMFGYNVNQLVSEDVMGDFINSRTRFNYIRTTGARIATRDMPEKDRQAIEMMFDAGVTIWHDTDNPLSYGPINHQVNISGIGALTETAAYHTQLMHSPDVKNAFVTFMQNPQQSLTDDQITRLDVDGNTIEPVQ